MAKHSQSGATPRSTAGTNPDTDRLPSGLPSRWNEELELDDPDFAELLTGEDGAFWDEFFYQEDVSAAFDDEEPDTFTVTMQNDQTGEIRTFKHVRFAAKKESIEV